MSLKCQPLSKAELAKLELHNEILGEQALAEAAGVNRLTVARARLGCRLYSAARAKLRAYLASDAKPLAGI